jgi:hypothetical protein
MVGFARISRVRVGVPDDGLIGRSMIGPQAGKVIAEDDIEHPMQPVADPPQCPRTMCEAVDVEPG